MKRNRHIAYAVCISAALGLCVVLSGCATTASQVLGDGPRETLNAGKNPIAVVVVLPERNVEFYEMIQKALIGIKSVANSYTYEGAWDPEPLLKDTIMASLKAKGVVNAVPAWTRLDEKTYKAVVAECAASFNQLRARKEVTMIQGGVLGEFVSSPPVEYMKAAPTPGLRDLGKSTETDLVLEIVMPGMAYKRGATIVKDVSSYHLPMYARIVRLSDGKVLRYAQHSEMINSKAVVGSFSDVESNNLALLKHHYKVAIAKVLAPRGRLLSGLLD